MAGAKELIIKLKTEYQKAGIEELRANAKQAAQDINNFKQGLYTGGDGFDALKTKAKFFNDEIKTTQREMKGLSGQTKMSANSMLEFGENLTVVVAGIKRVATAFINFSTDMMDAFNKQEMSVMKLQNGLKNLGDDGSLNKLTQQASQLQQISIFGDEDIINAQAMLTTFKLNSDEIEVLTPRLIDMASAMQQAGKEGADLQQLAILLGKATGGELVGALTRYGVIMDDVTKKQLENAKGLEKTKLIAEVLDQNFKGMGETLGNTTAGKIKQMENAFGDLKEKIGEVVANAVLPLVTAFKDVFEWLQNIPTGVLITGVAFVGLISTLVMVGMVVKTLAVAFTALHLSMGPIGWVIAGIAALSVGIGLLASSTDKASDSFKGFSNDIKETKDEIEKMEMVTKNMGQSLPKVEQENYNKTLDELITKFPGIVTGYDSKTGKAIIDKQKLDELIVAEKEHMLVLERKMLLEQLNNVKQKITDTDKLVKENEKLTLEYKNQIGYVEFLEKEHQKILDNLERYKNSTAAVENFNAQLKDNEEKIKTAKDRLAELGIQTKTLKNPLTELTDYFRELLIQGIKTGDIANVMSILNSAVQGNNFSVQALQSAYATMGNMGVASILNISEALKVNSKLMAEFNDAISMIAGGDVQGGIMKLMAVYNEASKYRPPTAPTGSRTGGKTRTSADTEKEKEKDAIEELIDSVKLEIEYQQSINNITDDILTKEQMKLVLKKEELEKTLLTETSEEKQKKIKEDIVKLSGEIINIDDIYIQKNEAIYKKEEEIRKEKEKQKKEQEEINRKLDEMFETLNMSLIEDKYEKERNEIERNYEKELEEFKKLTKDKKRIEEAEEKLKQKRDRQLAEIDRQEKLETYNRMNDTLSQSLNLAGQLAGIFSSGAENFATKLINGIQQALSIANTLISILNSIFKSSTDIFSGGLFGLLGFASGGYVSGPGTSTSDSIPARLSSGEYVVNAKATSQYLPLLEAINNGNGRNVGRYAMGGMVRNVNNNAVYLNANANWLQIWSENDPKYRKKQNYLRIK